MKYIKLTKKGNNFDAEIDPVILDEEIKTLENLLKLNDKSIQDLHKERAELDKQLQTLMGMKSMLTAEIVI